MTRTEALQEIIRKAEEMGLKGGYNDLSGSYWVSAPGNYTNISITERIDADRCDYRKFIRAGHFEVDASVSRMGGNPDADELFRAADEIRLAAGFVRACKEGFPYREDAEGNAA